MRKYKIFVILAFASLFYFFTARPAAAFDAEFEDKPLREVLKIFADELKVNLIADPKLTGLKVSASLRGMDAEDALELILKTNGLSFNQEAANTYTIFRASDAAKYMDANTRVFRIGYADPEKVASALRLLFPAVSFSADREKGTLFAAGPFSDYDAGVMESKVRLLDSKPLRVRVNYEIVKVSNDRVIETVVELEKAHGVFVKNARAAISRILSGASSVTKASVTLTPSEKPSTIESATTVPYAVSGPDGSFGVAESKAGDIFAVRAVSASPDAAVLEIGIDTGSFIGRPRPGTPPSSYSQKLTSVISVGDGERVLIGNLSKGGGDKIISYTEHEPGPAGGASGASVTGAVRRLESGAEECYVYLEANID